MLFITGLTIHCQGELPLLSYILYTLLGHFWFDSVRPVPFFSSLTQFENMTGIDDDYIIIYHKYASTIIIVVF